MTQDTDGKIALEHPRSPESAAGARALRPKLAISFSGGRTSAFMLRYCLLKYDATHDIQITFANTGCEHPATLDFVDACDRLIVGGRVVWLEGVYSPVKGEGVRHKVVSYKTASQDGTPYRDYIAKYGIPNMTNPSCTRALKTNVMHSYLATVGFVRGAGINHDTAIGLRADEIDRIAIDHQKQRWVYPLIETGITKSDVDNFWKAQPFDLQIPGDHYGNCVWCWKKSDRKLMTLAVDSPEVFDFPRRMEQEFGKHRIEAKAAKDGERRFFRKHRTVADLVAAAQKPFEKFVQPTGELPLTRYDPEMDIGSSCGETCEVGADS